MMFRTVDKRPILMLVLFATFFSTACNAVSEQTIALNQENIWSVAWISIIFLLFLLFVAVVGGYVWWRIQGDEQPEDAPVYDLEWAAQQTFVDW